MANKMTQKDYYNEIIALAEANGRDDLVDFANGRIEALNKKTANRKASANQEQNEELKTVILDVLADGRKTVSEMQAADETLKALSNQKVSAVLRLMKADGTVVKEIDKKKSYFKVV